MLPESMAVFPSLGRLRKESVTPAQFWLSLESCALAMFACWNRQAVLL